LPKLLHSLGGMASMGADVLQQGPHLRRSVSSASQTNADNDFLHVDHYDPWANEAVPVAPWGKKWGKVPHRLQPIST